ncbi:uncharacterized protein LOC125001029 [Mugil cephalus]|uniref:uncharacterized protein LOC125001029 n=1 Tax=Mugil cephalus TaxID=48193 RepID=UPI001FB74AF0|nr:uncharacterized protein LOC125001029 [Mugil cephalus]
MWQSSHFFNHLTENKPLLHGNNGEVQVLTTLDHINETETSDPPAKPPRRTSLSDPSDQPENPSAKTGEEESSADSQSPASHLNASDQSGTKSETEEEQETAAEQQQSGSPSVVSDHHENKPLLHGNNGEVQVLTTLDHINETEPSYPPAGPGRTSLSDPSDQPVTTSETSVDQAASTDPPPPLLSRISGIFYDHLKAAFGPIVTQQINK